METQTNQTNTSSTRQRVIAFLTEKGKAKIADIRAAMPDLKPNRVSVVLWQMKNSKAVIHNRKAGTYALTPVNNTEEQIAPSPAPKAEPKVAPAVTEKRLHIAQRDAKYWQERSEMHMNMLTQLREAHDDALAIIRYLENKLYVVLKQGK